MSRKLIVHQPTNHQSKKYRYYNIFFDNFIKKLSEKHDVVTDRYYRDAHLGQKLVRLGWQHNENDVDVLTYECEMIIEDYDTGETYVFGVADDLTSATLNLQSYDNVKKVFISQFIREKVYHHVSPQNQYKYFPWIYFPSNEYDLDYYYNLRKNMVISNDKFYFRGDTSTRPILNYFSPDVFYGGGPIGGFENYANEMLNFEIAFSVAGRGEICYRDIECMAMGIPFIRFEFTSEFHEPLIPNYHYISVERPDDLKDWMNLDRNGLQHHADMITKRFLEVKDDKEFLNFISENARKYYEKYLSPESSIEYTLNLLEL
jgi:hypothetical protein